MSQIIQITKENHLGIPIGTKLHFFSFFDYPKCNNILNWGTISVYVWQDILGNLNVLRETDVYPGLKGYYKNCIIVDNCKFILEGVEYWKVICDASQCKFHKLEYNNGKHFDAIPIKPYKDVVHDNTNAFGGYIRRFATECEAILFCKSYKNYLNDTKT